MVRPALEEHDMPDATKEKRHALRYKPAITVRAAYEWFDSTPVAVEGAITDFSVAGVALQYEGGRSELADSGRICLRLGSMTERFEVTLARLVPKTGGRWLAGLSFARRGECRNRARGLIEHLKSAYRAGAVQAKRTPGGPTACVLGNLNFNVVLSLHRLLRSDQPPRLIDLDRCTGADHAGIECLLQIAEQGIELKLDPRGRVAELIRRHGDAASAPEVPELLLLRA
jgi:hypothetical protein